ncbi:VCBS repeat-containing protein [Cognatitamlana onchidii]|uniref:VCBS repeat-containing protein n=1 Tax=Cognatitamlana onchidii TaxID=2562860 RepID=UPI0010A675AD|nr:VCBS repeat-containing protein [Algibacter onchidii]
MTSIKHNIPRIYYALVIPLTFCFFFNCTKAKESPLDKGTLFSLVHAEQSNITFSNNIKEDLYFNFLNYAYIYNGGGVAVGDVNNDGLDDLYFTSNQQSNALYINEGGFKFKDITSRAGVEDQGGWTTGVTMVDLNNDGWLDIYVCKSGSLKSHEQRKNKLFVNQKNGTFKEDAARFGLDHFGFSVQAYFFDFDTDGDLDMYLVNHRSDFQNNTVINPAIQAQKEPYHSDQLFRNDNGYFKNITKVAGIENKAWGLSASIGDFNNDGLPDIFVANDFLEPDFLYINQGNGTFKDEALKHFNHISANSMGSDFADINNDLKSDLVVLDMLAEDHIRSKENMASMSTSNFNLLVEQGYHHQYMSNMLQLNNGDGSFSEIGQLAGIAKTDWSWAPLIADFNNDGFKDIFVTNGIEHDLSNQDFRNQMRTNIRNRKKVSLEEAIGMMPSEKLSNYIFGNTGALGFVNQTVNWGLNRKVNSCGAVYADLDNDGDLDLITNNQSDVASIYQNNTHGNHLSITLNGPKTNTFGIGCKVILYTNGSGQSKTAYASRGFQSAISSKLHFGLGNQEAIDSLQIIWPDKKSQTILKPAINTRLVISHANSKPDMTIDPKRASLFETVSAESLGINIKQKENNFDDFKLQLLLPQKQSEKSSAIAIGDINNDGLDDLFIGNARGATAGLFTQDQAGMFHATNISLFESHKDFEDTDAALVDIDNDGDLDLYVTSGGYEVPIENNLLQDRLYKNDGTGKFSLTKLPKRFMNTKKVVFADWDQDGDQDAFVAGGVIHGKYPLANPSLLLENKNGQFKDVSQEKGLDQQELIMPNDAIFTDFDNDGDLDLLIVGEWMQIVCYENDNNAFKIKQFPELQSFSGWCQTIQEFDYNHDGFKDYLIGNWGHNNKFHPSNKKPLHIYADYLDNNESFDVVLSKVSKTGDLLPVRGKECSSQQTPFINKKLKTYQAFANSTLPEIYGSKALDKASHYQATNFSSILLKNINGVSFEIQELPIEAQFSPTLSFITHDFNADGFQDVFGVGNIYEAEVETIRYDASKGYVLLNRNGTQLEYLNDSSYFNNKETKAIKQVTINGQTYFVILNKNNTLSFLKLNAHKAL